ncbi:hypothetical protein VTO42DRAFT_7735 [Malbranchea cinnamomea]
MLARHRFVKEGKKNESSSGLMALSGNGTSGKLGCYCRPHKSRCRKMVHKPPKRLMDMGADSFKTNFAE